MTFKINRNVLRFFVFTFVAALIHFCAFGGDKDFPSKPNPPRLVNDFGGFLNEAEVAQLESKLDNYNRTSSIEITIVTIKSLGDYDVSDYAIKLGNLWGVGKDGKDDGVVILASMNEHKMNISTGKGLEGALTDAMCGRIIRNEMIPAFKQHNYFEGFSRGVDAVIAASKGEYTADDVQKGKDLPWWAIVVIVLVIYFVLWLINKMRGGGGGGNYMSGRGAAGFGAGWFLGGGGLGGGGFGGGSGSSDSGSGGFGGFGGGSFGGGGASGSW